ncbi:nitric oxide-sensing protein NosP [Marinobacterium sedimentorum]|uniref:nitric oxide-sensing protein NosP n=1 Tax=Marinobacterium sedimentorum TaxID=2927804 RepID=UPI0020C6222C|nr:nitric oxide-sensing protein NosP [Marinobacterium sedimentorum]MCP8686679.1 FIST C-terminal domain-containing protein [Marinobacterium sedimentorum]
MILDDLQPPATTAVSYSTDPATAARELCDRLRSPNLGFVLFFCSAEYDLEALGAALQTGFAGVGLAGCTTAGEITPQGYGQGCVTAIGFDARGFAIEGQLVKQIGRFSLTDAQAVVESLTAGCRARNLAPIKRNTFVLTLLDGLSSQEELFLVALNSALGSIPNFGGSAGDDIHLANTHVFFEGRFHTDAAVVLMFNTRCDFEVFSSHHIEHPGEKMVVTGADPDSRTVTELNAEPAALEYARMLGVSVAELDFRAFALNPVAVRIGDDYYVRSIQRVNADLSMTFYCAVEKGIVLTTMRPGAMLENLDAEFARIEQAIGTPRLVIGCDCFLRRLESECTGLDTTMSDYLQAHRVIGFNTYGEQFNGMHLNQTFTGVAIGGYRHDLR